LSQPRTIYQRFNLLFAVVVILWTSQAGYADDGAVAQPLATLPVSYVNNRPVISIPVAHYQLRLILDTGATSSALFQSDAHSFTDLPKSGTAKIIFPALDEIITGSKLAPVPFMLGEHSFSPSGLLLIHKRPPVGDRLNFKFDGVLGQDFFRQFVVELEPINNILRIYKTGTNLASKYKTQLKLHLKKNAPYIIFKNKMPWETKTAIKELLLDTGYPGLMVIWSDRHFRQAASQSEFEALKTNNTGIFTRASFRIGQLKFLSAPIFIAAKVPRQAQKRDGLIGSNILNQFHHVIDFTGGKLLLASRRLKFDHIDGGFYLPNNETFIEKNYNREVTIGTFIIE